MSSLNKKKEKMLKKIKKMKKKSIAVECYDKPVKKFVESASTSEKNTTFLPKGGCFDVVDGTIIHYTSEFDETVVARQCVACQRWFWSDTEPVDFKAVAEIGLCEPCEHQHLRVDLTHENLNLCPLVLEEKLPIDGEDYGIQPSFKSSETRTIGDTIIDYLIPDCVARWFAKLF